MLKNFSVRFYTAKVLILEIKKINDESKATTKILKLPTLDPVLLLEAPRLSSHQETRTYSSVQLVVLTKIMRSLDELKKENEEVRSKLDRQDEIFRAQALTNNKIKEMMSCILAILPPPP